MAVVAEETTSFALTEKSKLIKSLRRFDMVFFTVCAFVWLDTLGTVASNGPEGFFWLVLLALIFVAPYMLVMAEVGSAFTMEGGPYEWVKLAFRSFQGGIAAILYSFTVILYGIKHGFAGFSASDMSPTKAVFLGLVPVLLFNYVGFELQNAAAEEMNNPKRD